VIKLDLKLCIKVKFDVSAMYETMDWK